VGNEPRGARTPINVDSSMIYLFDL